MCVTLACMEKKSLSINCKITCDQHKLKTVGKGQFWANDLDFMNIWRIASSDIVHTKAYRSKIHKDIGMVKGLSSSYLLRLTSWLGLMFVVDLWLCKVLITKSKHRHFDNIFTLLKIMCLYIVCTDSYPEHKLCFLIQFMKHIKLIYDINLCVTRWHRRWGFS